MSQPDPDQGSRRNWSSFSGVPLKSHYGPDDVPDWARTASLAPPGTAPFLRGAYPKGYRTKPWRIFQLSGFGKPEDETSASSSFCPTVRRVS